MKARTILNFFDTLAILGIGVILSIAFYFQLKEFELPCALCVMQRMGFYGIGFGLILNLIYGENPKHYLLTIIAALGNGIMGLLQVLLHIVPGSGSFGSAVFGLHMYTWNFIISIIFILYSAIAGSICDTRQRLYPLSTLSKFAISFILVTLLLNIISAVIECGPHLCPSSPQSYWLFGISVHHLMPSSV